MTAASRTPEGAARHRFAVNVAAQGLARILSILANLALILAVARLMGAEVFGAFSLVLAFITISVSLADLGTTSVLARGLALHEGDARALYLGNFILVRAALMAVVMLGMVLVATLLQLGHTQTLLLAAAGLPVLATRFFEPVYQVYGRPWLSLSSNLAFGVTQLMLVGCVWLWPGLSLTTLIAGYLISNALYTLVAWHMMRRLTRPRLRADSGMLRDILWLAAPLGVSGIFTTLAQRADLFIIDHLLDTTAVGHYATATRIVDIAVFASVTLVTPLIPILSREIAVDRASALQRSRVFLQAACVLALPIVLIVPTVAQDLVVFVFGAQYASAAAPLKVLVWSALLVVLALIGSAINLANGEVAHAYWNAPLGAVIALSLNVLLIPRMGLVGAAWAALAGQTAMVVVSQYYTLTRFGNVYQKAVWLPLIAAALTLWLVLWLAHAWVGRWGAAALGMLAYLTLVWHWRLLPVDLALLLRKRPRSK